MKLNISLILKSISLLLIIISFFIPLYYYRYSISNDFSYFYINDLYTQQDADISIFTFYYLFVAFIILIGIIVDFFLIPIGSFQKTLKSINLVVFGSYVSLSSFFLFEVILDESLFWNNMGEDLLIITPALYLIILSGILFFLSFFSSYKSNTKKVDKQNKIKVLPYEQLAKLKKLYDEKVLTEEEFIAQKKSLIES
jgi:hypothetical protein